MTGSDAFDIAKRKATKGHRDWLVWRGADGAFIAAARSAETVKRAMLASGTRRRWYLICPRGINHIQNWAMGVLMIRNSRYGT
jgi:hypothetical protein